jgi:hypothetical protein
MKNIFKPVFRNVFKSVFDGQVFPNNTDLEYFFDGNDDNLNIIGTPLYVNAPAGPDTVGFRGDGINNYIEADEDGAVFGTIEEGKFSIHFRIATEVTGGNIIALNDNALPDGFRIRTSASGELRTVINGQTTSFNTFITDGKFHTIDLVFNGSGNNLECYIDTVKETTSPVVTYNLNRVTGALFKFLSSETGTSRLRGAIDDFKLFKNDALTNDEIKVLNENEQWWYPELINQNSRIYDSTRIDSITSSLGEVSLWGDLGENQDDVEQTLAGSGPLTGTTQFNSVNVLSFDGGDFLTKLNYLNPLDGNININVICRVDGTTANSDSIISMQADDKNFQVNAGLSGEFRCDVSKTGLGGGNLTGANDFLGTMHNFGILFDFENSLNTVLVDGIVDKSGPYINTVKDVVNLNIFSSRDQSKRPVGILGMVIVYNGNDDFTRQKIEGYAAWWFWGSNNPLDSNHPYKNKPPKKEWITLVDEDENIITDEKGNILGYYR